MWFFIGTNYGVWIYIYIYYVYVQMVQDIDARFCNVKHARLENPQASHEGL